MNKTLKQSIRGLLEKQIGTTRKKQLNETYFKIFGKSFQGTKSAMIDVIADMLADKVMLMKTNGQTNQQMKNYLITFFQENGWKMYSSRKVYIENIIQQQFQENYQQQLPRQSRSFQEIVPNILTEQNYRVQCICQQPSKTFNKNAQNQPCYKCGRLFHPQCLWQKQSDQHFECPFCYLKYCIPSKNVNEVFFAGYLVRSKRQKSQFKIAFNISHQLKKDKGIAFQARCARLINKSRYQLTWPDNCLISMGNKRIAQLKPLAKNSPLKRRNDQQIRLQRSAILTSNQMIIEQKNYPDQKNVKVGRYDHLIIIVAVTIISQLQLQKYFKQSTMGINACKNIFRKYINRSISHQIYVQKLSVSLQCQYYDQKILYPMRSKHCNTHYQPFDLRSFLFASIRSKNSTLKWKCPICKKRAYDLILDQYLYEIIEKNKQRNIKQIVFRAQDAQPQIVQRQISQLDQNQQKQMLQFFQGKQKLSNNIFQIGKQNNNNNLPFVILDSQQERQQLQMQNQRQIQNQPNIQKQNNQQIQQGINNYPQKNKQSQKQINISSEDEVPSPHFQNHLKRPPQPNTQIVQESENAYLRKFRKLQSEQLVIPVNPPKQTLSLIKPVQITQEKIQKINELLMNPKQNLMKSKNSPSFALPNNIINSRIQQSFNKPFFQLKAPPKGFKNSIKLQREVLSAREPQLIQIQSDVESPQDLTKRKLQQQKKLLQQMTKTLNRKWNNIITTSDQILFEDICRKLLSIKMPGND